MNISTLLYAGIFLCASLCCPPEDDGLLYFDTEVADVASVRNNTTLYTVGDTLWVQVSVPKIVTSDGETSNISELAGNAQFAYVNFSVFETNDFDNPSPILFSENELVAQLGNISVTNQYIGATALLQTNSFECVFGLVLKEPGTYFITGDEYRDGKLTVSLDTSNSVIVTLTSNIINATLENRYEFVVK